MNGHLTQEALNALVDGELTLEQLAGAKEHLARCPACTTYALDQSLLKSVTAKAGRRYEPSPNFEQRLTQMARNEDSQPRSQRDEHSPAASSRRGWQAGSLGWAAAAVLVVAAVSAMLMQRTAQRSESASAERAALATEVLDQHVATLAGNVAPQVVSTDRHTVKPWFQGKIPFSFNLPQSLPSDTSLDGANLTYLGDQPVAQLVYSIGKHRVSVFLRQKSGGAEPNQWSAEHSGFHVMEFSTSDLQAIAVSDVDRTRLAELVDELKRAQAESARSAGPGAR